MNEQWKELKETIIELRDGDGTTAQQEVCKFLANYMDILEKQMQEPCGDAISRQAVMDALCDNCELFEQTCSSKCEEYHFLATLSPVTPQPKTGHWIKISPANIFECSECGQNVMTSNICAYKFCHGCGAKMIEPQNSEKDEHMTADEFAELFTGSED